MPGQIMVIECDDL